MIPGELIWRVKERLDLLFETSKSEIEVGEE
jgi:hypothetical protein